MNYITENKDFYTFKENNYEKGFLDSCIDATYIIYLEGNEERMKNINEQLAKYQPTKNVYILFNKGYKNCNKKLPQQKATFDLVDSFYQIFGHAREKNYNNILILEDDFMFNEKIKDEELNSNLCHFLNGKNITDDFAYLLGCVPYFQIPSLETFGYEKYPHNRLLVSTGTHSIIYSKGFREKLLSKNQNDLEDWDLYLNFNSYETSRYIHSQPLCYQLFYESDNFGSWNDFLNIKYIMMFIFKLLGMNNEPEPGFSIFYLLSKIPLYLFIIFILFCLILVSNFFPKF